MLRALPLAMFVALAASLLSAADVNGSAKSDAWLAAAKVGPVPEALKLDPFYKKYVDVVGIPVVSSERTTDAALLEAGYLLHLMVRDRPDMCQAMHDNGSRLVVMAAGEMTTDVPEFARMTPKDFWDRRARGMGGQPHRPVTTCGEENLLALDGDPYSTENIFIHEFAHAVHHMGMDYIDKTFDRKLNEIFERAMAKGLWKGKYAATNRAEYWAEAVQSYFGTNRAPDHDHNHVDTKKELEEYDPEVAALVSEVFKAADWTYVHPTKRGEQPHLKGLDRAKLPKFVWPERLGEETRKLDAMKQKKREEQLAEKEKGAEKTPEASAQKSVEKTEEKSPAKPVRITATERELREIDGWNVHVDVRLLAAPHLELGENALTMITSQLFDIASRVERDRLARLREVPIYLDLENEKLVPAQYHPDAGWLKNNGHDPKLAKGVHIPSARDFARPRHHREQPCVLMHELAHAYHDRVLGFDHAAVQGAYDAAVKAGVYESVLHISGRKQKHYALTNQKEFFAEATEAYFGTNDFYPFVRAELSEHDARLFRLLKELWGDVP